MASKSNRASVNQKILSIACSFALPIAVLAWLMVSNINSSIRFAEKEVQGIAYLRPLIHAFHLTQDHRAARQRCAPDAAGCDAQLRSIAGQANAAFGELRVAQQRHGVELQFEQAGLALRDRQDVHPDLVSARWEKLAAAPATTPAAQLQDEYDLLADNLKTMITHVGDTSNLILDPDLDSYYLMDVVLLAVPQNQDRIRRVLNQSGQEAVAQSPDPQWRTRLAVHAALLREADLDRVVLSSQTALREDANFYGTSPTLSASLQPALQRYAAASEQFAERVAERSSAAADVPGAATEFAGAGEAARAAALAYWDVAAAELAELLSIRIANFTSNRSTAVGLSGLALLIAGLLSFYLARSITAPLQNLVESLGPGATLLGVCVERIGTASKSQFSNADETEIICEELHSHADSMRHAVHELTCHVRGVQADDPATSTIEYSQAA